MKLETSNKEITMNLDELTIGDARRLAGMFQASNAASHPIPFKVGEKWLLRGVTNYIVGEVVDVCGAFLVLRNASWVADCGRFSEAMETGQLNEVEHQEARCVFNTGALVDAFEWHHALPEITK